MSRRIVALLVAVPLLAACAAPLRVSPPAAGAPPSASRADNGGREGPAGSGAVPHAATRGTSHVDNAPAAPASREGTPDGRVPETASNPFAAALNKPAARPASPAPPPENLDWTRQVNWLESADWAGTGSGGSGTASTGFFLPPVDRPGGTAAGDNALEPAAASLLIDESWVRLAVTGAEGGGPHIPMGEAGFARGEFRTAEDARARLGQAEGVTYLYWDDFRKAVVANAPNKPFAQLAFRGGDWQIWCTPGGGSNPTLCRMGITYMDRTAGRRRVAFTLLYAPGGAGLVLCVGSGVRGTSDGSGAELTIDRVHAFRSGGGNCYPPADSRRIVEGLMAGDAFTFRYRPASRGAEYQGWLSPYGLEQAMALMGWMYRRLDGRGPSREAGG